MGSDSDAIKKSLEEAKAFREQRMIEDMKSARRMYANGRDLQQICKTLRRSWVTVRKWLELDDKCT